MTESAPALLKRTPFFPCHVTHGATFYEKGGWVRAARYEPTSVAEHLRLRERGGIFDAHSMGKVRVSGQDAAAVLDRALTADIAGLEQGQARYSCLCRPDGGIIDDLIVYRIAPTAYYIVTNTLSRARVVDTLADLAPAGVHVEDVSSAIAYLAVQGPESRAVLQRAGVRDDLSSAVLPYFGCSDVTLRNVPVLLARTGYTGELGYELNFPAEYALDVWELVCEAGAALGVAPVGAQAMMSLRLEKGYRSYGADIDETTDPLEAGLQWVVHWSKGAFQGREALEVVRERGVQRRLLCLKAAKGVELAPGDKLYGLDGACIGEVTSGLFGPSLGTYVGLGYLYSAAAAGATAWVTPNREGEVELSPRPFFDPTTSRARA